MAKVSAFSITGVLAALLSLNGAAAADLVLVPQQMADADVDLMQPAVSGPNGKWELFIGPTSPGSFSARAAGSLSLPVGERFGVQVDGALSVNGAGSWLAGGVLHAFTRDPDSYLLGVATGVVRGPTATLGVVGLEGEAYIDNFSLEGWGGLAAINYDVLPDVSGLFAIADAAYYFTDDFRASVGFQHLIGVSGLRLGAEYQMRDWSLPASISTEATFNTDGSWSVMAGLKGYFGGDDGKSLKDRHRQDDPPNRALSLFGATGNALSKTASASCEPSFNEDTLEVTCATVDEGEAFCSDYDVDYRYDPDGHFCYDPEY